MGKDLASELSVESVDLLLGLDLKVSAMTSVEIGFKNFVLENEFLLSFGVLVCC